MSNVTPTGWRKTKLGKIVEFKYGKALPAKKRDSKGHPVYGSNGVVGYHSEALTNGPTIIIGRKGSVGEVHISEQSCSPIDTTYFIDELHGQPIKFWGLFLKSLDLRSLNKATAIPGINRNDAYNLDIMVPPLPEQKRIADKLDCLLSKVDACKSRLDKVPEIIKRFRQSVLADATSGRLTECWRAKNPKSENTQDIINKIHEQKVIRNKALIEDAKKNGTKIPRKKIMKNISVQPSNNESSWTFFQLSDLLHPADIFDGPFGSNLKTSDYTESGVQVIRLENIGFMSFDDEKKTFISDQKYQTLKRHTVKEGDLIFSSFISDNVRAVVLPPLSGTAIAKADCFCVRPIEKILDRNFLCSILSSPVFFKYLVSDTHGATRPRINTGQLKNLTIPLPSLEEQKEIVKRVEALFYIADQMEKKLKRAQVGVDKLTASILAKAFKGELVPQELNDEPVEQLLELANL